MLWLSAKNKKVIDHMIKTEIPYIHLNEIEINTTGPALEEAMDSILIEMYGNNNGERESAYGGECCNLPSRMARHYIINVNLMLDPYY